MTCRHGSKGGRCSPLQSFGLNFQQLGWQRGFTGVKWGSWCSVRRRWAGWTWKINMGTGAMIVTSISWSRSCCMVASSWSVERCKSGREVRPHHLEYSAMPMTHYSTWQQADSPFLNFSALGWVAAYLSINSWILFVGINRFIRKHCASQVKSSKWWLLMIHYECMS